MRKLLFILFLGATLNAASLPPIPKQEARLTKYLWKLQKEFGLDETRVDLHVMRRADMRMQEVWGDSWNKEYFHIEVLALQDYPVSQLVDKKAAMQLQKDTVLHELLHGIIAAANGPDDLINTLLSRIKTP